MGTLKILLAELRTLAVSLTALKKDRDRLHQAVIARDRRAYIGSESTVRACGYCGARENQCGSNCPRRAYPLRAR